MAKIGYARVSTQDQSLDSQIDILKNFGCSKIFKEKSKWILSYKIIVGI